MECDGEQHFSHWHDPEHTQKRDIFKMEQAILNGYKIRRVSAIDVRESENWKDDLLQSILSSDDIFGYVSSIPHHAETYRIYELHLQNLEASTPGPEKKSPHCHTHQNQITMSVEHFRTGNPDIVFSSYPGSEFPHQCGGGYGYGGYGQYGTYGSCATYDHYNANKVDYNDGVSCGAPPMKPIVSDCNAPAPLKPATKCGPCAGAGSMEGFCGCGGACGCGGNCGGGCGCGSGSGSGSGCGKEGFAGAGDNACNLGCAKPAWWGDIGCQMPPKHCGAGSCGYYGADGAYKPQGQAGFETFDGAMAAYSCSPYAADAHTYVDTPIAGDCDATFGAQHKPGCNCVKCMMPYSAPYHVGPGCGRPTCRCKQCDGDCKCGAKQHEGHVLAAMKARAMRLKAGAMGGLEDIGEGLLKPRNLIIALLVAYLAYRLFRR